MWLTSLTEGSFASENLPKLLKTYTFQTVAEFVGSTWKIMMLTVQQYFRKHFSYFWNAHLHLHF